MRKLFSLFLALVATTTLWAYDFKSGNLYYNITSSSAPYTVEVTYQQSSSSSNYSGLTIATIPKTVTYNGTTYSVTSIGDRAFLYCSSLNSVTIPNSVTYIGEAAFNSCSSLTSITIPNSVTSIGERAFTGCSSLTSPVYNAHCFAYMPTSFKGAYVIPEGIKQIAGGAFYNCSSLTSITIPNSVTSIGDKAFSGCESLTSLTIPNSVTSFGREAFYDCSSLTSVTIPNSVTSIGYYAFRGTGIYNDNSNWENDVLYIDNCLIDAKEQISGTYTIKKNTRLIAAYAFNNCSSLTSITIPNSVTSIGEEAFDGCSSLKSITIPNSVTSIEKWAFGGCKSLTSVTIGSGVTSIGKSAFSNCTSLTSITIPKSVKSIGENAFEFCSSLTSVTIPNSVTSIGGYAFYGTGIYNDNSNWENNVLYIDNCLIYAKDQISGTYTIKKNTRLIADYAFRNCSSLTSITIPNSITSIGSSAFKNCSSLTSITCEAETPPTLGSDAFYAVSKSIPVYVPCGCVEAYKAASGWKEFTDIQEPQVEYAIQVSTSNSQMGTAKVDYNTYCEGAHISALAYDRYHFVQWSDGNTDNPRTLTLTQNTVLTAEFAPNKYTITTVSSDTQRGTTQGDTTVNYLEYITISATASYGYHFVQWNDGNTQNPRQVQVTKDMTYTATFDKNTYAISLSCNEGGRVEGVTSAEYLDKVTISATPNIGYHFVQWSDGVTDNPRTLTLTQDTVLTAEFAINQYTITTVSSDTQRGTTQGDTTVNYLEYITISATASYGYHFVQWNDGNTQNPRTVKVTEDKTYTAYFEKSTYTITKHYNTQHGSISGSTSGKYLDVISLTAIPNTGYHFSQWHDGVTDNPRSFVLTQDTTFAAFFAVNHYQLNISTNNPDAGTVSGAGTYEYGTYTEISATANYGYHFSHWNDGNTDNPRTVKVTEDRTYTAYFDNNTYSIYVDYDRAYGVVTYPTSGKYKDEINLQATPNLGYTFVGWSDGIKDNPRTIVLEGDIYLSANFTQAYSGQCGDNAYWKYDPTSQTISIMGFGEMYHYTPNTQPWILFKEKIRKVEIANDITSLGTSAFAGCRSLGEVHIGHNLIDIYTNAFADCKRLYHVYCYPTYPPFADISSFANYTADLHIQCESKEDYVRDEVWGKFSIKCLGAETEELPSGEVTTTTTNSSVTITWPTESNADTYTIVIKKDGEVFCTLTFNAEGQLLNIAFAPGRDGNHPAQYAEQAVNGYRFTVTSLESGTKYGYNIDVKDASNKTIKSHSGEFTTQSTTAVDNITTNNASIQKVIRDGQLIILRNGVEYNAMGQEL